MKEGHNYCNDVHTYVAELPVNGTLPPQDNYNIRLVNGFSDYDGRVELLANKQWGTICDSGWGISDANVNKYTYITAFILCTYSSRLCVINLVTYLLLMLL